MSDDAGTGSYALSDVQWWLRAEYEKHDALLTCVKQIRSQQEDRKFKDQLHASLYGQLARPGLRCGSGGGRHARPSRAQRSPEHDCAVTSKIAAKGKIRPTFTTTNGTYEDKIQAETLEAFTAGVFYQNEVYGLLTDVFRDCCTYGTGILKIYDDEDRVTVNRVYPYEVVIDDAEGRYGEPKNYYQRRYYDRVVLKAIFGKDPVKTAAIAACVRDPEDVEFHHQTAADQILVTEAWHLGETRKAKGRHVIAIDGCTLVDEVWIGRRRSRSFAGVRRTTRTASGVSASRKSFAISSARSTSSCARSNAVTT